MGSLLTSLTSIAQISMDMKEHVYLSASEISPLFFMLLRVGIASQMMGSLLFFPFGLPNMTLHSLLDVLPVSFPFLTDLHLASEGKQGTGSEEFSL